MSLAGAVAGGVAGARRMEEMREYEEQDHIVSHLGQIVERGRDEYLWLVEVNVSGLPELKRSFAEKILGLRRRYKTTTESSGIYLMRVFKEFEFYGNGKGMLVGRRRELSLYFGMEPHDQKTEERDIVLFEPYLTACDRITARVPVRIHETDVHYKRFQMDGSAGDGSKVTLPDFIHFYSSSKLFAPEISNL